MHNSSHLGRALQQFRRDIEPLKAIQTPNTPPGGLFHEEDRHGSPHSGPILTPSPTPSTLVVDKPSLG